MAILSYLNQVVSGANLSFDEADEAMRAMLSGETSTTLVAAFLAALRTKGENADELAGFATAMRALSIKVPLDLTSGPVVDTCGTGGDGAHTFNISTVAAFVVAGSGVRVAKHGNRAISSRCGSADVLEALGISLIASPSLAARAIEQTGIGFLFAPAFHPAMKYVMPARLELKMRTAFNLLGPLANPACATHQVIGAPGVSQARTIAQALLRLPVQKAFVVHGSDGLDEVTTTGPTAIFEVHPANGERQHGEVIEWEFHPETLGIPLARSEDFAGGDAAENAETALRILSGEPGAKRNIVLVNAAFALLASGRATTLEAAWTMAADTVESRRALACLEALRALCNESSD